jgi:hypothetical protein
VKPVASFASDQQRSSIFPSITGVVLVRTAAKDLTGPRTAETVLAHTKNAMKGRLLMMIRMCFMLLCFMSSACRFLYDNLGCLLLSIELRALRLPKFTVIGVFLQPFVARFMLYLQHVVFVSRPNTLPLDFKSLSG